MMRLWAVVACLFVFCGGCATAEIGDGKGELTADFELRVATGPPGSLDPAKAGSEAAVWILRQICDPLVGTDAATGQLVPAVAESWALSDDARRITFSLRSGARFHSGREVVAGDYVFSMSRLASPETDSPYDHLMQKVAGFEQVQGGQVPVLAGVTAPDPSTLVVELSEPFAEFPAIMANPAAGAAVPAEALSDPGRDFDAAPVCTGPYRVDAPTGGGEQIRLVRFDDYAGSYPALAEDGRGFPSSISWTITGDDREAYALLDDGSVDVAPVPHAMLQEATQVQGRVSSSDSGHLTYLGLPVDVPGFDRPELRQALSLSLDRTAVVEDALGGTRGIAGGFVPKSAGPAAALSGCVDTFPAEAQPAAAQEAMESASGALPDEFNVYLNTGAGHEPWLAQVLEQWQFALGADASLQAREWGPYLEFLRDPGPDGPFRLSWAVQYPSPEAVLGPLFSADSLDNFSGYANAEFDELLASAAATLDPGERSSIYAEAAALLCRDVPAIPVWFGADHVGFGPAVVATGEVRIDVFGDPLLRELKSRQP